ncbi:MAG TPA: cytochrome c biogenesis protein DipZ [Candidatus Baltobacteraceae bacterium]|jgi:cytochrome c biogenesis protein CcdA/thiol-disulfide isomerase/thioredoxin|nr:cytochrome c biogenesis protein DipZ [Candidatus Baltobacteraceae bacterium]
MLLFALAFVGGALTILSPCILPVLPFVFARSDQPFWKNGLPLLLGMAATFTLVASLASYGGAWVVQTNQYGRDAALIALGVFALSLLSPRLSEWISRPFVRLGNRLAPSTTGSGVLQSFMLGVATGLLWAPCAGPILGLVLTGAALNGASVNTTLLLLSYALGAALSLGLALLAGNRVFQTLKRSLGFEERFRRILGVAILVGIAMIYLGLDRGLLTKLSDQRTTEFEQRLLDRVQVPTRAVAANVPKYAAPLADEGPAPDFLGTESWLNSPPLTLATLRGKVILVDFWTYSCINCLRALPYVRAWDEKYRSRGLVVIGVHTPEFPFEKDPANVQRAVTELGITYPVALDNQYLIWRAFHNQYWPAHYFIDANGRLRHEHFGEGNYDESEHVIQELLQERDGRSAKSDEIVRVDAKGVEAPADNADIQTEETYLGSARAQNFSSPERMNTHASQSYTTPSQLSLNEWGLTGRWTASDDLVSLDTAPGAITFRYHARDMHVVLGPPSSGKPVRFQVRIDGHAPGIEAGVDTDPNGFGTVREQRLYQIIRQKFPVRDRTVEIRFLDSGVKAYSFTFG